MGQAWLLCFIYLGVWAVSFFIGVVYRTNRRAYPSLMYSASEFVCLSLVVVGRNNVLMRLFELACLIDRRIL